MPGIAGVPPVELTLIRTAGLGPNAVHVPIFPLVAVTTQETPSRFQAFFVVLTKTGKVACLTPTPPFGRSSDTPTRTAVTFIFPASEASEDATEVVWLA